MALNRVQTPFEREKSAAIRRGIRWVLGMQGKDGGWASFDRGAAGDQGGKDRRQPCQGGALGGDQQKDAHAPDGGILAHTNPHAVVLGEPKPSE